MFGPWVGVYYYYYTVYLSHGLVYMYKFPLGWCTLYTVNTSHGFIIIQIPKVLYCTDLQRFYRSHEVAYKSIMWCTVVGDKGLYARKAMGWAVRIADMTPP